MFKFPEKLKSRIEKAWRTHVTSPGELKNAIRKAERILPGIPAPRDEKDPRWQAILKIEDFVEI